MPPSLFIGDMVVQLSVPKQMWGLLTEGMRVLNARNAAFSSRKLMWKLASLFNHLPPIRIESRWAPHPIFEASRKIIVSTGGGIMSLPLFKWAESIHYCR